MTYRSHRMLPLAMIIAIGSAVAVAVGTEASTAARDEAANASLMVHSADPSFSTIERKRLRQICGLGARTGQYQSTIMCNSAEAVNPQVSAIIARPRNFAGSLNPNAPVPSKMMASVQASIISANTGVSKVWSSRCWTSLNT